MLKKTLAVVVALVINVFGLTDQTFVDLDGKTYSLFAELEKGRAFLIQHEDAW